MSGRYRALRKIADGGTAEIFLAEREGEEGFRRHVVLKRIRPEYLTSDLYRQMFFDEARLAMALHHSNIVQVLDLGRSGDQTFMVLELVDGWTLAQLLKRARAAQLQLPPALAIYIASEVCRALAFAHRGTVDGQPLKLVHRDVCPYNVLVSSTADVKLTDFGIAKTTISSHQSGVGVVKGKPGFMSPEQAMAQPLDGRSDLFSLGCVLYALLSDEFPFKGETGAEKMAAAVRGDYVPLGKRVKGLPKALIKVVEQAMAIDPKERFESAEAMLKALEKVQRTALEPMGRSELEAWLRALSERDGAQPLGQPPKESPPPLPAGAGPMWIELSDEGSGVGTKKLQRRGSRVAPVLVGLSITAAVIAWLALRSPSAPRRDGLAPVAASAGASGVSSSNGETPANVEAEAAPALGALDASASPAAVAEVSSTPVEAALDAGPEWHELPSTAVETTAAAIVAKAPEPEAESSLGAAVEKASSPETETVAGAGGAGGAERATGGAAGGNSRPSAPAPVKPVAVKPAPEVAGALKTKVRVVPTADGPPDRVTVHFDTQPAGASVAVDKKVLGTTPVALKFRPGTRYAIELAVGGKKPQRQLLNVVRHPNGKSAAWLEPAE